MPIFPGGSGGILTVTNSGTVSISPVSEIDFSGGITLTGTSPTAHLAVSGGAALVTEAYGGGAISPTNTLAFVASNVINAGGGSVNVVPNWAGPVISTISNNLTVVNETAFAGTLDIHSSPTIGSNGSLSPIVFNGNSAVPTIFLGQTVDDAIGLTANNARRVVTSFGGAALFNGRAAEGNPAAPTATASGRILSSMQGTGYDTAWASLASGALRIIAIENFTTTAHGADAVFLNTPAGSTVMAEGARLSGAQIFLVGLTVPIGAAKLQAAGGVRTDVLNIGTVATPPQILSGSGAPTVTAPSGSIFLRNDGSVGARTYINQDGTSSWSAIALV